MSELTGRLDDMSTEGQPVCVSAYVCARASFFHWSLLTPIKVLHMTGLQQQSHSSLFFYSPSKRGFKISPLAVTRTEFYMNRIFR